MLTVKECQNVELEIMQNIHLFCEKYNLKYVMAYGTLLGAVRHKGFIPWDNDMDIAMPRPDFEKFLELVKDNSVGEHLYCAYYRTDPKYHYQVIRVCDDRTKVYAPYLREQPEKMGVWVDIFPIDGVWKHPYFHPIQKLRLLFNQILQRGDIYGKKEAKGLKTKIKRLIYLLFPCKNNQHAYAVDKFASKCPYEKQDIVGITVERKGCQYFDREDFENRKLLPFEQYAFYGPDNVNKTLTDTYGDYMTLPPEDKRETHDINAEFI